MNVILPEYDHVERGLRFGRNVYEGYQRGLATSDPDRLLAITKDASYARAEKIATERVLTFPARRADIFLILKYFLPAIPHGHVIEFGCFRGGMAMMMASICKDVLPGVHVYALDTFRGMPEVDPVVDFVKTDSFKVKVDYAETVEFAAKNGLDNLTFVEGRFEDTAVSILDAAKKIAFVHIDCDIRSAVAYAYEVVKPYLVDGAYIVFDDATGAGFIGATEVVEEFVIRRDRMHSEQIYPHFVFRHNL
jgi:predicted O-methyltransferase YrrM